MKGLRRLASVAFGRAAEAVVVIFALILGEKTFGLVGALLAVPVASMIQVLFVFFYKKTWKKDPGLTGPMPTVGPP